MKSATQKIRNRMFRTKHLKSNRLQKRCYLNRQRLQTTTNHHKRSQATNKQRHTTKKNNQRPQNTNKLLQTTNKRTLTTSKRPQKTTPVHQTETLTFLFFFLHPVIARNIPILKTILFTVPHKQSRGKGGPNSCAGADKGVKY